jgi:hypothetical protein
VVAEIAALAVAAENVVLVVVAENVAPAVVIALKDYQIINGINVACILIILQLIVPLQPSCTKQWLLLI